jgi:hypothetical protein
MKKIHAFLPLVMAGCLTHMPADGDPVHLHINWHASYEEAERAAATSKRPVLVCLIAGDIIEKC